MFHMSLLGIVFSEVFSQEESDITILHSLQLHSDPSLFDFENHFVADAEPFVDFKIKC